MKKRQILRAAAGLGLLAAPAYAQAPFPSSRIRMVVAFPPGGVADLTARPIAVPLERILRQRVLIETRAGAGGAIGQIGGGAGDKDGRHKVKAGGRSGIGCGPRRRARSR